MTKGKKDDLNIAGLKMSRGGMLALGATGLALTAGAIAAGIALSDKKTRTKLAKTTRRGISTLRRGAKRLQEQYQARYLPTTHTIKRDRKKTKAQALKKRSKK